MILKRGAKIIGELKDGVLYKKVIEVKHLFHARGSVPAIDAPTWNQYKDRIDRIEIRTDKGRIFRISRDDFERHKELLDYGWGKQFVVDKEYWGLEDTTLELPSIQKEKKMVSLFE